tara:strand:+ start:584 stop:973 length:390 start_codon:yes stop_codon:yes gene_type:complete
MITKNQIRILSGLYYLIKEKQQRIVLSHHLRKEMPDIKQGTLSTTLQSLEHKFGLIISLPCDGALRSMYGIYKSPGTLRKYYVTASGKKLVNMYLQIVKQDAKKVDYEKLSSTAYAVIRTPERRLTQGF